jgi:hypothetical protein
VIVGIEGHKEQLGLWRQHKTIAQNVQNVQKTTIG